MKVAIIGTRGIPAKYGGFETCKWKFLSGLRKKRFFSNCIVVK